MAIASLIVDYKGNLTRFAFYLLTENLLTFKDDRFRACHRSANRFLKFAYQFDIAFCLEVISRLDIRVLIAYLCSHSMPGRCLRWARGLLWAGALLRVPARERVRRLVGLSLRLSGFR